MQEVGIDRDNLQAENSSSSENKKKTWQNNLIFAALNVLEKETFVEIVNTL